MCITGLAASSFFFQAEDGIRDLTVTGVQTCALPICVAGEDLVAALAVQDDFDPGVAGQRDRKSVVYGKSVDLGGRRIIKKKNFLPVWLCFSLLRFGIPS